MQKYEVRPYMVDSEHVLLEARGNYSSYKVVPLDEPFQSGFGVFDTADNRCVFTTGRGTPDDESRAMCEAHIIEREMRERMVAIELANGTLIEVVAGIAEEVRGIDAEGYILVRGGDLDGGEWLYALTKCCQASAKGCGDGTTACRSCYHEIPEHLGSPFYAEDIAVAVKA
jgi:hypothetical protein